MKSVSQSRQMKYTLSITCQCFHGAVGRQLRREAAEGPRQSAHVQIPLHWLNKIKLWPPVISLTPLHTHIRTHMCHFPSCSLAHCDFLLVSLWPASSWLYQEMSLFWSWTHTHTHTPSYTLTPPNTCTHQPVDIMKGSGLLLPVPWPKVAPSAWHE